MISLRRFVWQGLFGGEIPPDLISIGMPSIEERRKLLDQTRKSIAERELILQRLESAKGCFPESFSTNSPA